MVNATKSNSNRRQKEKFNCAFAIAVNNFDASQTSDLMIFPAWSWSRLMQKAKNTFFLFLLYHFLLSPVVVVNFLPYRFLTWVIQIQYRQLMARRKVISEKKGSVTGIRAIKCLLFVARQGKSLHSAYATCRKHSAGHRPRSKPPNSGHPFVFYD